MRRWLVPLLSVGAAAAGAVAYVTTSAAATSSSHCHRYRCVSGVSIRAVPDPSTEGVPVTISGGVSGRGRAGASVVLWHRLLTSHRFTRVSFTRANSSGRYTFFRADGVVSTNRQWYVVVDGHFSRVLSERVHALVTLNVSDTAPAVGEKVTLVRPREPVPQRRTGFARATQGRPALADDRAAAARFAL